MDELTALCQILNYVVLGEECWNYHEQELQIHGGESGQGTS